ncbi:ciliated left-right organizer metallopeptidase [Erpetoichthys calabaricus]|uniref:ciliated left-right organizer metallopeptidase n=1 Tax=Erpetoichthys calabaricus TaxID=27687 RepID=UPI00223422F2|nr:ciliated left-right organizer metallopeptidase [Erpetoichthys calabaricus]
MMTPCHWLLVVLWLPSITVFSVPFQSCLHDEVQSSVSVVSAPQTPKSGSQLQPAGLYLRQSLPPMLPIRIHSWMATSQSDLSADERARLDSAVNEATVIIASLLSVNRVPGRLLLNRDINKYCKSIWRNSSLPNYNRCGISNENYRIETCLDVVIPDEHLSGYAVWSATGDQPREVIKEDGVGVMDADFLLYVQAADTDKCRSEPSVIAYASYCQLDASDRPIAGAVVFCRARLTARQFNHPKTVLTAVHELLHALGFSRELFDKWRDCSDSPAVGISCSSRSFVTNTDEYGQFRIYTQKVIKAMQDHLKSSSHEAGGPLENKDGVGMLSSHWEARFLQGSIMAASLGEPWHVQIDQITLAALADTGWYQVNMSAAESLIWGAGEGDSFGLKSSCSAQTSQFFCMGSGPGCHYLHFDKGVCTTDDFLEGCRIYKPLSNDSACWMEANGAVAMTWLSGEIFGPESRCFFANLSRKNSTSQNETALSLTGSCYLHRCTGENAFQVKVLGSDWLNCTAGEAIQVPGYTGVLFCPDGRLCGPTRGLLAPFVQATTVSSVTSPTSTTGASAMVMSSSVEVVFMVMEKTSEVSTTTWSQYANLPVEAMINATGLDRCHFQNVLLRDPLHLTLDLVWQSPECRTMSLADVYQTLWSSVQQRQISYWLQGTNYIAYEVKLLSSSVGSPDISALPGAANSSTERAMSPVAVATLCGGLGMVLAFSLVCVGLTLLYKRKRLARIRVHHQS